MRNNATEITSINAGARASASVRATDGMVATDLESACRDASDRASLPFPVSESWSKLLSFEHSMQASVTIAGKYTAERKRGCRDLCDLFFYLFRFPQVQRDRLDLDVLCWRWKADSTLK